MGESTQRIGTGEVTGTGQRRRVPRRIGLLDLGPRREAGATGFLLADFAEALLAYDRVSNLPGAETEPPQIAPIDRRAGSLAGLDALVIGRELEEIDARGLDRLLSRSGGGLAGPGGNADMRVYAIAVTELESSPSYELALRDLAAWCRERGLVWGGGALVAGEALVWAARGTARMGWLLRRSSEALDRLIGAVRGGMTVPEAGIAYGAPVRASSRGPRVPADVILARSPLPRPLAHRVANLLRRGGRDR